MEKKEIESLYEKFNEKFKLDENANFEESLNNKEWFYPVAFMKINNWYYITCITWDFQFDFRILSDWDINEWSELGHEYFNNFKDYLEAEQNWFISRWLIIIPIEKMKKVTLENVNDYIKELEKEIEKNQEDYKKRVKEIVEYWRQFC